jgi:hypothetical protein
VWFAGQLDDGDLAAVTPSFSCQRLCGSAKWDILYETGVAARDAHQKVAAVLYVGPAASRTRHLEHLRRRRSPRLYPSAIRRCIYAAISADSPGAFTASKSTWDGRPPSRLVAFKIEGWA